MFTSLSRMEGIGQELRFNALERTLLGLQEMEAPKLAELHTERTIFMERYLQDALFGFKTMGEP